MQFNIFSWSCSLQVHMNWRMYSSTAVSQTIASKLHLAHSPERRLLMNTPCDPSLAWELCSGKAVLCCSSADVKITRPRKLRLRWFSFSFNHLCSSSRFSFITEKKRERNLVQFYRQYSLTWVGNCFCFCQRKFTPKVKSPGRLVIEQLFWMDIREHLNFTIWIPQEFLQNLKPWDYVVYLNPKKP